MHMHIKMLIFFVLIISYKQSAFLTFYQTADIFDSFRVIILRRWHFEFFSEQNKTLTLKSNIFDIRGRGIGLKRFLGSIKGILKVNLCAIALYGIFNVLGAK